MTDWRATMEQLVRTRERALLGYAYLVCGDPVQSQDLVQDALVRTFSKPRPGLEIDKAEGYVRRAITTVYIDQYRRGQRWQRVRHLFQSDEVGDDEFGPIDAGAEVADALRTLPPRVRACVVLRYFDDLTVPSIAKELEIAEGTVKRYLSDGIGHLEQSLGALDDADRAAETVVVSSRGGRSGS
ncbi:sigma-70 family RNA polymerase sigma factor [Demequina capsici]|uniref:Sigma-70 family RNA polymerase sigma factor n=1 Tax=Demequina capsici TaxID=3075620 RepID=A0AA96JB73_9MICO|nr:MULTISPECIES: sigma-70 family RNA polymerase sigma factor [unclassified Demequina]WNM24841.1 sigma-70 family RNA polymerase sigma factor [Demequina sp. OYTSA14]WNM27748.1 sigma-70 family RNA polymerase sigma factor [Demequina sp. PMTSA13]